MERKIGFIGCGNMGEAFLKGIIDSKIVTKDNIFVYARSKNDEIKEKYDVNICKDESDVVKAADFIFLAVKPNVYFDVIDKIKKVMKVAKIIISMAPGLSMSAIENRISEKKKYKVIRTMPNLPLMVQSGCIAYTYNEKITGDEKIIFDELFSKIGMAIEIKEKMFDAIVGATGSSPAFIYMFIEALADGAVLAGLPRKNAYSLIAQTVIGCGKMVLESGKHPGELKDNVCSPGGTTIVGVKSLEDKNFRGAVIDAVSDTVEKSKKMGL